MNPIQDSVSFLVETVLHLAMVLVLLRFLFGLMRVDFRNPIVSVVVKITQIPLAWLRRFVPGLYGIDLSAVVLFIGLMLLKLLLLGLLVGAGFNIVGGIIFALAKLIDMTIWAFIIAIIAQAIMSWFIRQPGHPLLSLLDDFTQPILRPARNMLPSMSGIDLSPMVVYIVLKFIQKLLVAPLYYTALQLM